MNIHASRSQFSNPPDSGVNLTTEPDSTLKIAANTMVGRFQLPTVPYLSANQLQNHENRLFDSSHSCHLTPWEALQSHEGGQGLSVSIVNLTFEPGPIFKYT